MRDVNWKNLKFWAGQTPPKEYCEPVDPYRNRETTCLPTLNHLELSRYLKKTGKKASELSREEIQTFVVAGKAIDMDVNESR